MKKRKPLLITALTALLLLPSTAWAEGYPVRIGEEQLTSENIGNYPGVEYDPSTKKLILNGVKLTESISRMLDDTNWSYFTIVLKGKNSITVTTGGPCIYYEGVNATPAIVLERGDDACSLSLSCQNGSNVMEEFTNTIGTQIDLNEDLHDDKIKWIWFVEKTEEKNSVTYITQASMAIPYDISFGNGGTIVKQIHSGNASDVYGDKTDTSGPTVSFNPDNNTLTLNKASLDSEGIVSGLDNLTIHLKGENKIGTESGDPVEKGISSTVSTAKLTFTSEIDVENNNCPTGKLYFPYATTPIDGFSDITYKNGLDFAVVYVYLQGDIPCVGEIGYGLFIGDTQATSANCSPIKDYEGNSIGASYDKVKHTLTLEKATLKTPICWENHYNLKIIVKGQNYITTGDSPCIYSTAYVEHLDHSRSSSASTRGSIEYFSDLLFDKAGDDPSYLGLSCNEGTDVISGFGNSTNPDTPENLSFNQVKGLSYKAEVREEYSVIIGDVMIHSGNYKDVLNDKTNTTEPTVSFNPDNNTLTLNEASFSKEIQDGLKALTIHLIGENTIDGGTTRPGINITTPNAKLTFTSPVNENNEPTGMLVFENVTTPIDGCDNIYYENDLAFGTDENGNKAVMYFENYLEINGVRISDDYSADGNSGTIAYSKNDKTITLTNYQEIFEGDAIVTSIVGLKVKLAGKSTFTIPDEAHAFRAMLAASSIKFLKDGNGSEELTVTTSDTPFKNFSNENVTYDGLICFQSGDNEWAIKQPAKPVLSWRTDDTDHYTYATLSNADEVEFYTASPTLKYSFDYADEQQEVKNQVFPEDGIKMTGPGVLTAWVEVDGIKSEEVTGVRFGMTENIVKAVYNGSPTTCSITIEPATKLTGFTVTLDSKPEFVSFDSEKKELTVNGCGKGEFSLKFTNTAAVAAPEFVVLGDTAKYQIEVIPAKPIISLASGEYDETKTVALSSTVNGASIKFYLGDTAPETPQTYTAPINITKSTKLTAWVVSNDMKSQTETATYTIYQIFVNPYKDSQIWACFFSTEDDMTLPDNLEAYFITDIGETALSITQLDYLPKKVPVLIKKTGDLTGAKYTEYTGNPSTVSFENIILKYATDPIGATGKQYVLFNNEFVKATGSIPAGRCYIELDSNSGNVHARSLSIGDGNGTTGVESGEWSMINGQWYDLQGRRIQKPAKSGLYIVKGKLVMYNNK